jgi:hypothetical protein
MSPQILMFYPELFFNLPLHFHWRKGLLLSSGYGRFPKFLE